MGIERAECVRCADCKFFHLAGAIRIEGTCRRRAPVILGNFELPTWPKVLLDDWCGDGRLRIEVKE